MIIRDLGQCSYQETCAAMQAFTRQRTAETEDEIWLLEHEPVFTQGVNGKEKHILNAGDIPVIRTDRGGQVTYHGPGQLIAYTLFDLRRLQKTVRQMVSWLEYSVIMLLRNYQLESCAREDAPGVYVAGKKIASLGLKVTRGCCYHGLSLNVAMDLRPFSRINPCGYPTMEMVDMNTLGIRANMDDVKQQWITAFKATQTVKSHYE